MMTRIEHLQAINFLPKCRYKCSLCYENQFTSHFKLGKGILRAVSNSKKVTKFYLMEEVPFVRGRQRRV